MTTYGESTPLSDLQGELERNTTGQADSLLHQGSVCMVCRCRTVLISTAAPVNREKLSYVFLPEPTEKTRLQLPHLCNSLALGFRQRLPSPSLSTVVWKMAGVDRFGS